MRNSRVALMSMVVLAMAAGCADEIQRPVIDPQVQPLVFAGSDTKPLSASDLIGPAGGSIVLNGRTLSVPANALAGTVLISMTERPDGSLDLQPEGLTFAVDASLTFQTPTDASFYLVQWFDPHNGAWVTIPSFPGAAGRTAPLQHFSTYKLTLVE